MLQFVKNIYQSFHGKTWDTGESDGPWPGRPPDNPGPLSDSQYVLSIFLDLKKAFDTVDHEILIEKLKYYGCDSSVIMWFTSYLSNRCQFTQIDGINSENGIINCGVPQGSILGPLLFLIYINDLPDIIKFMTLLYADDTTFQILDVNLCAEGVHLMGSA